MTRQLERCGAGRRQTIRPAQRILPLTVLTVTAIFAVLFGLVFGSFLNVCISRLPLGESVVAPGSRCPRCRTPIRSTDNIPLLSWLLLRGRCRQCGAVIPLRYPLVEAATAALFLLCFLQFGLTVHGAGAAILCFLLVGLAAMDAETFLLPDAFTLTGLAFGIAFSGSPTGLDTIHVRPAGAPTLASVLTAAAMAAAWAVVAGGAVLLIRWIYRLVRRQEGMGLGDAKLVAMIAAWFGPSRTLLVFFLAVVTGAIFGLGLILARRLGGANETISELPTRVPFGAFLCLSTIFALFLGQQTLKWYLGFFG